MKSVGNLSDRLRPDVECAPWVIEQVKRLEAERDEVLTALAEMNLLYDAQCRATIRTKNDGEVACGVIARERDDLEAALRGLLLSRDASWTGGHDWHEAVDQACRALGVEPGDE